MCERRDDELFAELCSAIGALDPVPDRVRFTARMSLAWRTVDADLDVRPSPGSAEPGDRYPEL